MLSKGRAQQTGDYRTIGTASFSLATNWQTYNTPTADGTWQTATVAPANAATTVTTQVSNTSFVVKSTIGTTVTTINNASTNSTITVSVSSTSGVVVGQVVSGTNIPSNATVVSFVANTSITLSAAATGTGSGITLTLSTPNTATGSTTSGSATINLTAANANIVAGQPITGSGIPANSYIVSYNAGAPSIVISANATATASGVALTFGGQVASNNIIELQSATSVAVGMPISATGIAGTNYVTAINIGGNANCIQISSGPSSTRPSNFITVGGLQPSNNRIYLGASNGAIVAGQLVLGSSIPAGTYVSSISGQQLVLSQGATSVASSSTLSFYAASTTITNMYINHNTTVDASNTAVITNLFINNSASTNAGTGFTYTNATLTIGNSSTNRALSVGALTVASNASLVLASTGTLHSLVLSGTGTVINNSGTITLSGTPKCNTYFTGTGTVNITGNGAFIFNDVNIVTGTTLVAPSGTMGINGNLLNNGTFTHNSGTVSFGGTTTFSGNATTFNNIALTSGATFTTAVTGNNINGNIVNNGTSFTNTSSTLNFTGTNVLSGSGAFNFNAITISGAFTAPATMTVGDAFTFTGTAFTHNSGTINFNAGASRNITGTLTGSNAFYNVNFNGTATHTLVNSVEVAGTLAISNTEILKAPGAGLQLIVGKDFSMANTSNFTHNGGTVVFNGTTQAISSTSSNALAFNALNISSSGVVTLNAATSTAGTTTIDAGATLATTTAFTSNGSVNCNGSFQLNTGGSVAGTGTWVYGNGTLVFNTTGVTTVNNADIYWPTTSSPANITILQGGLTLNTGANRTVNGVFQTAAAVSFPSATLTINGTAQLNTGGTFAHVPIYGSSSLLKYNTGGIFNRGNEWSATTGTVGTTAGLPQSVQVSNNTTLNYPNGNVSPARTLAGNLTVDAGSSFYMDYGTPSTSTGALTVGGNVTANGNVSLGNLAGGDIYVGGNWTHGVGTFTTNARNVILNGIVAQTISNTNAGSESFPNLTITNTNGGVSLNSSVTVTNTLTINSGIVGTNANQIALTNTATSALTGTFSATCFINGTLAWTLPATSSSNYLFPVGSGTGYYPLTLNSPSTSTSGTTVATVQVALSNSGGSVDNTTVSAVSGTEYWSVASSVGNITAGNISLTRTGVSIVPYNLISRSTSLAGMYTSIGGTASGSSINSSNSIATINSGNTSYFVLGTYSTTPTITGITGGATTNSGYIGQLLTINGANFVSGTTVAFNGGSANATTFINATQVKTSIPANATSGNITATVSGTVTNGYSFSILGYISAQAGDWSSPSTWVGGAVPPIGSTVTIAHAVTISTANYATSVSNLTISNGGTITFGSTDTLSVNTFVNNGTIRMTSGGVLILTGSTPTVTNNGTFTYGIGTVAMNGTVSNTVTGQNNFYNISVGGNAALCNDTLYGSLTTTGTGSYSCSPVGAGNLPGYGAGQTVNIYASPNGSGVGSGSSFNLPVNLTRAKVVAQNYPNNPVNVLLKDGTYYQLTLTSADARSASAPAIYKAINKGKAIFQPLKVINRADFQPIPDSVKQRIIDPTAKGKVMQLNLASYNINAQSVTPWATVVNNTPKYPIFYQNTTPLMLSRYPNDTTMSMNGVIYKGTNKTDSGGIFYYSDTRTNRWVNAMNDEGVWLAGNWRVSFVIQYIKTKTIDTVNKIIYQKDGVQLGIGNKFAAYAGNYQEPYYVSNLFEEIDTVGEFSINFNNKMLYMWVPDTGIIQYADSLTMPAISATGASYTQFQNINFIGGASNAIAVSSANHVRIAGCDFTQCTDDAIVLTDVTYSAVQSNDIHQVGAGGVAMFNNSYNTDINTLKRGYDTVINNYFYDYAKQTPLYNAAIDPGGCIGVYVANNKVRKCPHIGIAYGFGGGDLSTFEYNEVDSVVLVYSDMGALYGTGVWKDRGHKMNHNYLHDILGANGLYLDNNTSGDTCVYNIVANSIWGMGNNGGNYNRFYNNIFVNQFKPAVGNYTADTIIDFVRNCPVIKNLWYSNPVWQSTFPELIDLVDSVNGVNKSFTSQYWSQMKNNTFFTFGPNFAGQTLAYVNDASLFNADGSTNNTYAQTGDPFVRWGTVFQNNYKVYNKLKNPIYPFLMDSLRSPGLLTYAGATDWHINRIGVYVDSFRTDISAIGVKGIAPYINLSVNSTTNHILPDTSIITATVVLPNASNCFSNIQFYDNGAALNGLTVSKTTVSYDTVTYAITYIGAALGNHSITCKLTDAPYWQYTSTPFTFTTDSAMTWTGNTNTDWNTASNWSNNRTPLSTDVVTVPGSASRMPVINSGTKKIKRFTLKTGSSITLQNSTDTLAVTGDIQSAGTFSGNGVLQVLSTTTTPLSAGQSWGVTVYYGGSGQTVVSGNYTRLDLSGGNSTLSSSGTIAVSGDLVLGSTTVSAGTSTVLINGSGTQSISGTIGFYNLQVNKSGVVNPLTLGGAVTVSNNLVLTSGRIVSTATNTLTISNSATSAVANGGSAAYIDGPLSWKVASGSNSYVFPVGDYNATSQYLPDTITNVATSGVITITAYNATCGGTYNTTLSSISTTEYWSVQSSVANTITLTIAPANLASNNVVGQSSSTNGVYASVGGTVSQTSILASGIVLAANTPAWFVAAYYPNPLITSVVSCLPGIASGTFFPRDTLTITGNYFQTSNSVIVGGQPASVIIAQSSFPTMMKVLVSSTASTGIIKVGSTNYNGTFVPGYVTRYDGSWNTGTTWLGGVVPPNGTSYKDTIAINNVVTMATSVSGIQTLTINSGASFTTSNVGTTFNSGATLTNNGTYSSSNNSVYTNLNFINNGKSTLGAQSYVNINLTNNTGDSIIISSASVTMSGTITNNGYFKHNATGFYLNGSITFNGSNVDTINSITTNANATGTITFTTAPYLTGNFSLNSNFTVTGNYPTYSATANLYYNTGASQPVGTEWKPNVSSGAGIPALVLLGNGNTGSSVVLTGGNSYKCGSLLTVSSGCSLSVPATTVIQSSGLKVVGTVSIADGGQIQSASTVTINSTGTLNVGTDVLSAPATTSNASLLVSSGAINDTGVVNNYGYIKIAASNFVLLNTGSLGMPANAVLELANASPAIPVISWDPNSYLYLSGVTSGNPTNMAQTFGNVVWNSTAQTGNLSITGLNAITNSFIVLNTGSGSIRLNNTTNTYGTLQVGGSNNFNGNTVIATAASLNIGYSTAGATTVNGNVAIGANGTLAASTIGTSLALTGNWINAGTFTNVNTTVLFNGTTTTAQTITKTGGETFNNLSINTSGTGGVALNNAVTIANNLNLSNGILVLGNNNLTINAATTISNASASSYMLTAGTGLLIKNTIAATAFTFPVGTSNTYTPLTVANTSGTSNLSVAVSPTITYGVGTPSKMLNVQWTVIGSAATTATMTYQFNTTNAAGSFVAVNTCELGIYTSAYSISSVGTPGGSNPFTLSKTGISLVSGATNLFVIGNTGGVSCTTGTYVGINGGDANLATNWCGGALPSYLTNIVIANNAPLLTANLSVNNLSLTSGLNLNGYNLTVNGIVSGSGTIVGNSASTINMLGNGTLYFDQTVPGTSNVLNNLVINSAGTVSLGNNLNLLGTLTPTAGTFNTNGNLTLISTSAGTARIDQVFGTVSGNVTVQRYIPPKLLRKFSYIGSPVYQTIRNAWQQQIYITGYGTGGTLCGGTYGDGGNTDKYNSNGFDFSIANSASIYTYNPAKQNGSRYVGIANTDYTYLVPGKGYCVNIRGNRNSANVSCINQLGTATPTSPEAVTLSATGTLTKGDVVIALNDFAVHKFTLLANPYPSQISFKSLQADNSCINYKMWTLSPYSNSNYTTYSAGVIANGAPGYDDIRGDYLAIGQAFFVEANKNGNVTFKESHKINSTIPNTQYFGETTNKIIRVGYKTTSDDLLDEVVVRCHPQGTMEYNPALDAASLNTGSQTLTINKKGLVLAIASLPDNPMIDTVLLGVKSNADGNYKLYFSDYTQLDATTDIILRDKFLNTTQDIRLNQTYAFNITADTMSQGKNRFEIILKANNTTLPVHTIHVVATEENNAVLLYWKVTNPKNTTSYQVDRSTDGIHFETLGSVIGGEASSYSFKDNKIIPATTLYYRIKSVADDGSFKYSNIASLALQAGKRPLSIYPNPVKDNLSILLSDNFTDTYKLRVLTVEGKEVLGTNKVTGNGKTLNLPLKESLNGGVYWVELTDSKGDIQFGKFLKD